MSEGKCCEKCRPFVDKGFTAFDSYREMSEGERLEHKQKMMRVARDRPNRMYHLLGDIPMTQPFRTEVLCDLCGEKVRVYFKIAFREVDR